MDYKPNIVSNCYPEVMPTAPPMYDQSSPYNSGNQSYNPQNSGSGYVPSQANEPNRAPPAYPGNQYTPSSVYPASTSGYASNVYPQSVSYPQAQYPSQYTTQAQYPSQVQYPPAYPQASYSVPQVSQFPLQPFPTAGSNTTYVVRDAFDSGARFDPNTPAVVPPPPPGCVPNVAQMAIAQGSSVFLGQKKENWFSGGSGGGTSFW